MYVLIFFFIFYFFFKMYLLSKVDGFRVSYKSLYQDDVAKRVVRPEVFFPFLILDILPHNSRHNNRKLKSNQTKKNPNKKMSLQEQLFLSLIAMEAFLFQAKLPMVWLWLCGCVVVWLCGCVVVWLCGCVVVWLCDCVVVWLCDCGCGSLCDGTISKLNQTSSNQNS